MMISLCLLSPAQRHASNALHVINVSATDAFGVAITHNHIEPSFPVLPGLGRVGNAIIVMAFSIPCGLAG